LACGLGATAEREGQPMSTVNGTIAACPTALQVCPENIPDELKARACWVVWHYVEEIDAESGEVGWDKPPRNVRTGRLASSTDAKTWGSYKEAMAAYRRGGLDGIGFVLSKCEAHADPFVAIDLDKCRDPATGSIEEWALRIVHTINSYTEVSPSGRGLRIFLRGALPPFGRKKGPYENYETGRYVTVTGHHVKGTPGTLENRQAELESVHRGIFGEAPGPSSASPANGASSLDLDDEALLRVAFQAKNGDRIHRLWEGDISGYASRSEADLALARHLAFYVRTPERIDHLFRRSGLFRSKWDRDDYRGRTIQKALDGMAHFYDPNRGRQGSNTRKANEPHGHNSQRANEQGAPPAQDHPHAEKSQGGMETHEAVDDPHRLARLFLQDYCKDGITTMCYWREEWYEHVGAVYRLLPKDELKGRLSARIKNEFDRAVCAEVAAWEVNHSADAKGKPVARKVTLRLISDVVLALAGLTIVPARVQTPAWLGENGQSGDWAAEQLLVCRNTVVSLPALVDGRDSYVRKLTPQLFNLNALDCDFVEDVPPPAEWEAFLKRTWPKDEAAIVTLQEWFGYCLLPDTRQQKILMIVGPKRSGKGTIARVLRALVGIQNTAGPTLASLGTNFGLWPLLGKSVAIISDARLSGHTDAAVVTERLLSISGEDALTVDRKNLSPVTCQLPVRFVILTNELPRLNDPSGALVGRLIVLRQTESWYGREDITLTAKLLNELPSILGWAIRGYARLREQGHFFQPESGKKLVTDLEDLSSPIGAFIRECCKVGPDCEVLVRDLYERWKNWCGVKGRKEPGTEQIFGRDLRAAVPYLDVRQPRSGGGRVRIYEGIRLLTPAEEGEELPG
jgi:P4 family phage/plasmid primase-like protien